MVKRRRLSLLHASHSLFGGDGGISPAVSFPDLAAHVFFAETGQPIPKRLSKTLHFAGYIPRKSRRQ